MNLPLIGLTMGDPAGVGPELCLKAAVEPAILDVCRPLVFGNSHILKRVMDACGPHKTLHAMPAMKAIAADARDNGSKYDFDNIHPAADRVYCFPGTPQNGADGQLGSADVANSIQPGQISATTGQMSFDFISGAIDDAIAGHLDAVVTAPIHKEAWGAAGLTYPGHTELLAEKTSVDEFCMLMTSPRLSCSLVTCHVGIDAVARQITTKRIVEVIRLTHESLAASLGRHPRLVVLGLNPHAGENGLFGDEESRLIQPAIDVSQQAGINVTGPIPPDTAFLPAKLKEFDGHVCMYHDQGLIPFKALAFDTGVNVTLGLPIIRTSVDHGTALDIAWKGTADPSSMYAAIRMAVKMAS